MHEALLTLGFALVTASILALSAVAFTLEYAVTNVANVSHGEILTAGAYAAYLVHQRTGSAIAAAIAASIAGGLVALAMHSAVIGPFIRFGASPTIVFIATLGMSFVIQNLLVIFFGAANVAYTLDPGAPQQLGPFLLTPLDVEIVASAIAACLMLSLSGCATVKADAKDVAAVCRPELLGDAVQILPLVAALAICEAQGQDCSVTISQLEADGKADAQACALAQLHAATVKLSATPDAGTH